MRSVDSAFRHSVIALVLAIRVRLPRLSQLLDGLRVIFQSGDLARYATIAGLAVTER